MVERIKACLQEEDKELLDKLVEMTLHTLSEVITEHFNLCDVILFFMCWWFILLNSQLTLQSYLYLAEEEEEETLILAFPNFQKARRYPVLYD